MKCEIVAAVLLSRGSPARDLADWCRVLFLLQFCFYFR